MGDMAISEETQTHADYPSSTRFEWPIYRDATLAGLSPLIPIPFLDWITEGYFRSRIPRAIARYRGYPLDTRIAAGLNMGRVDCLRTCIAFPVLVVWEILRRLSRKLLYFLSIKEASDRVAEYWLRAYLIDTMLQEAHLESMFTTRAARLAMINTIAGAETSPLKRLASGVVQNMRGGWRSLRKARRNQDDPEITNQERYIARNWSEYAGYLDSIAQQYMQSYEQELKALRFREKHTSG